MCAVEQFCHLRLREPDSLIFNTNFDMKFPALRLVHDNLIFVFDWQRLFFAHISLLPANTLEITGLFCSVVQIYIL